MIMTNRIGVFVMKSRGNIFGFVVVLSAVLMLFAEFFRNLPQLLGF